MTTEYTIAAAIVITAAAATITTLCIKSVYLNAKELVDSFHSANKIETNLSVAAKKTRGKKRKNVQAKIINTTSVRNKLINVLKQNGGSLTSGFLNQKYGIRRPELNMMLELFSNNFTEEITKGKNGVIKKIISLNKIYDTEKNN